MANWVHINGTARMTFHEHFHSLLEKQKFINRLDEYLQDIREKCKNNLQVKFQANVFSDFNNQSSREDRYFEIADSEIIVSFYADIESANNDDKKYSDYFDNVFHKSNIYWHAGIVEIIDDYNGKEIMVYDWQKQYKYEKENEEE